MKKNFFCFIYFSTDKRLSSSIITTKVLYLLFKGKGYMKYAQFIKREVYVKTIWDAIFHPSHWQNVNSCRNNPLNRFFKNKHSHSLLMGIKWRGIGLYLAKLHVHLPFVLKIPLVGIYPKNTPLTLQENTSIRLFIAALFITANIETSQRPIHLLNGVLNSWKIKKHKTFPWNDKLISRIIKWGKHDTKDYM